MYWKLRLHRIEDFMKMVRLSRKVFHILLSLYLCLATFIVVSLPEECFCGQACPHCAFGGVETRANGTYDERCHDPGCKSCNVEKLVILDAQTFYKTDGVKKSQDEQGLVTISTEFLFDNHTHVHLDTICSSGGRYSPPIYLQNLSLLF